MLNISNVYKSYGEKEVLKGVSFKVNAGEIVGLIGENGSGKTTLIKTILGSVIADSGVIQFKEKDNYISDSFSMKEIGYLLDIDLIQELNAVELLKLYSLYENKGYNLKKTEEALQEFKLPRGSKIKEYSYGMQQRLRLLLALDETRQLLILDEPLLGLDITSIDLMKKVLKQFVSQGGSVLLSSHQLAEIQDIVDRYIILDDGIINEEFTGNSVVFQVEVRSELGEFVKLTSLLNECDVLFQKEEEHRRLYVDPENLNRVLQEAFKLNLEVNIEQKNIINQTLLRKSKVGSNE